VVGLPAVQAAYQKLSETDTARLSRAVGGPNRVPGGYADIYFVPAAHSADFVRLCRTFAQHLVWVEIAVPTIFAILAGRDIVSSEKLGDLAKRSESGNVEGNDLYLSARQFLENSAKAVGRPYKDHMAGFHARTQDMEGRRLWMTDRATNIIWNEQYSVAIDYVRKLPVERCSLLRLTF
jgi:hypothetical protein